jgi:APA family basic amino acid/polyamine antiporter
MVNIGTLLAFVIVCASVIVLRIKHPDLPRPFKVPGYPWVPACGVLSSFALMTFLPIETWERLAIWLVLGMVVYFAYGKKNSKVQASLK